MPNFLSLLYEAGASESADSVGRSNLWLFVILLALLSKYKKTASKEVLKQIRDEITVQRTNLNLVKKLHSKAEFQSKRVSELIGTISEGRSFTVK